MKKVLISSLVLLLLLAMPLSLAFTPTVRVDARARETVDTFTIGYTTLTDVYLKVNLKLKRFIEGRDIGKVDLRLNVRGYLDDDRATMQVKIKNRRGYGSLDPIEGGTVLVKDAVVCEYLQGLGKYCEKTEVILDVDFEEDRFRVTTLGSTTSWIELNGRI